MASEQDRRKPFLSLAELAVVVGIISILIAVLIPAVNRAREAARRAQSRNNLKQVALALYNYHDSFTVFPPGGVFDAEGDGFHEWTTMIAPYLDASPWYSWIDFNRPWDDSQQVAFFRNRHQDQFGIWANPSLPDPVRPDGLVLNHYAGSQTVFFRNSSVSLSQVENRAQRMLVADAYAQFLPVGAPFGWRDVTLGLARDSDGFGCSEREITQCVMADGSVRELPRSTADEVLRMMAGPEDQQPTGAQVDRIKEYPMIDVSKAWKAELESIDEAREENHKPGFVLISPDSSTVLNYLEYKH